VFIDSHTHIDMKQFSSDREHVIQRARDAGLAAMIDVGIDLESSRAAVGLSGKYPDVYATAGFHPHNAASVGPSEIEELAALAGQRKVVAIGEIGLDFYRNLSPREAQVDAFERQLGLARELGLPVVVHSRQAQDEVLSLLTTWAKGSKGLLGVLHCFSGDIELAERYIGMGFFISIAGTITYKKSAAVDVVCGLPLDRLLIETDCPFLAPEPHRGRRNEPSYVPLVAERIAAIRGVDTQVVADASSANCVELFRLPM